MAAEPGHLMLQGWGREQEKRSTQVTERQPGAVNPTHTVDPHYLQILYLQQLLQVKIYL